MNPVVAQNLARVRRPLFVTAIVAVALAVALGFFTPAAVLPAYRLAIFACLALAMGSLLFTLIHYTTGGQWGDALAPFLLTGSRLAPWVWLLVLPLVFVSPAPSSDWPRYESRAMLALRGAIGAVVLFAITSQLKRGRMSAPRWIGPVGLIAAVFTLHVLADDWLMALERHWRSTAFPLVWMTGEAVAGLACAVFAAITCGASLREPLSQPRALGLDWGDLLLAAMLFWCYVAFAQFLIIWAGNLPAEISWFKDRVRGAWSIVPPALACFHFLVPFALLLSRTAKRSRRLLGFVAGLLLAAQLVNVAWFILPAFPLDGFAAAALTLALPVGALAFFLHRYAAGAQRRL